jgi:hypothetical protein
MTHCNQPKPESEAVLPAQRAELLRRLEDDGFVVVEGVFTARAVDELLRELTAALDHSAGTDPAVLGQRGEIYGARNLLRLWPRAATVWRTPPIPELLTAALGQDFGLVRGLYFDKPPERSWSLPWHKDLTIAVMDNRLRSTQFEHPTRKAGVPHVEAPTDVLERMATVRIQLDEVTDENGPLLVLPGSHRTGRELVLGETAPHRVHAGRGSVLLMRPLLAHSSVNSRPGTPRHRRTLHLEFAGGRALPDGYEWHDFLPATAGGERTSAPACP